MTAPKNTISTHLRAAAEAARAQAEALELAATEMEHAANSSGFIDQSASPLGKRGHLRACKNGLRHRRIGKRRIVALVDLERWMAEHDQPRPTTPKSALRDTLGLEAK